MDNADEWNIRSQLHIPRWVASRCNHEFCTDQVYLLDNNTRVAVLNSGNNFSASYIPVAGQTHTLTAHAVNNYGLDDSSSLTITILSDRAPEISLTSPATTEPIALGPITLSATASDSDGDSIRVTFYDGNQPIATNNAAPYACTVSLPPGTHPIHAVAKSTYFSVSSITNTLFVEDAPGLVWVSPSGGT